jgi:N-acetylglucosamine-6-sulfatase
MQRELECLAFRPEGDAAMLHRIMRISTLCLTVVGFGMAFATHAASRDGPCEQITAACRDAGFVRGGAKNGNALRLDCVDPIVQGTARRPKASLPLPQVDPQLVQACKIQRLGAGQPQAALAVPVAVPKVPSRMASNSGSHPNIVFVLTDDLALNLVQYMPHVLQMQKDGLTFANYFVTDSLCCPSRSSIFTGRYPHNTGIFRNVGKDGGYQGFRARGHERATFATALSAAGYRTAMLGKYLNGYSPAKDPPAAGWTSWSVAGGGGYAEFRYNLNQDGKIVHYGDKPADYLTDVLSGLATRFIKEQAAGSPFFIEVATFAPHGPYTPAPRDSNAFPDVRAPRPPSYNSIPDPAGPKWLLTHSALADADIAGIDRDFRKRAQSVLAIDKMIGELQAAVAAIGQERNTYFVFSSDNGYHMGEHRLLPGKMTAYDSDIHVPLIVTGPGVPAGVTAQEFAENVDLCPTFTDLGGAVSPANVDGRSLVPLLHGQKSQDWRTVALIEHRGQIRDSSDPDMPGPRSGNPPTYEAIRSSTYLYVEFSDGDREYHDLTADPHELRNAYSSLSGAQKSSLSAIVDAVRKCRDARACWTAEHSNPANLSR